MSNPDNSNPDVFRDESESSVRVLTPPPPEPPIEISETEMSDDSSENQYGFV
ncbi:hypothetical protein MKX03_009888, partial [Papaver bracteatum]